MQGVVNDVRFAVRGLLRAPLLLVTCVATLAIGLGLSTGVLAVAYGTLLRPLPFVDADRVVAIESRWATESRGDGGVPLTDVDEWRRRARAFAGIAGQATAEFTVRGAGEPRTARVAMVTDGFFDVLGVAPGQGQLRSVEGTTPAAAASRAFAAVLRASNGAAAATVGTTAFSIEAVLPSAFAFPSADVALWVPARAVDAVRFFAQDDQRRFRLVARLAPGVSIAQAQEDVDRVVREMNEPLQERRRRAATVRPIAEQVRGDAASSVVIFVAGAGLVLLIACANVSGLLVGRAVSRRHEFAVRRAIGGTAAHLLRAALAETLTVVAAGWLAGLGIAALVVRGFLAFGERAIPNLTAVRVDVTVIAGSGLLALGVALLTAGAPALRAVRSGPGQLLKETSGRTPRGAAAARGLLVSLQVALAVVLLVCAGLLARTVMRIVEAERGFDVRDGYAVRLMLADGVRFNATDRLPVVHRILAEVRQLPGVTAAGIGSDLPPGGQQIAMTIRVVRGQVDHTFRLGFASVTPGYLEALGARLVKGRLLDDRDHLSAVPTVVITTTSARQIFGDQDPLGREWPATIPNPGGKQVRPHIVGVISDIKYGGLDRDADAGIFTTWERMAPSQSYLVVRSAGQSPAVRAGIREALRRAEASMPLYPVETLDEVVAGSLADRRLRLQLAAAFAALSLALAAIALWGAVAQSVLDRRRELAIRLALGESGSGAVALLVRRSAVLIAAGVLPGLMLAGFSARGLRHLLHGVGAFDPLTFAAGATVAVVVSALASYVPARRAASISPAELLRD